MRDILPPDFHPVAISCMGAVSTSLT